MGRKFIFVKDVEKVLAEGKKEWVLPEGACLTDAAADLVKERGLQLKTVGPPTGAGPSPQGKRRETSDGSQDNLSSVKGTTGIIAVASSGQHPGDPVGSVAARSPYYLLFDSGGTFLSAIQNPYVNTGEGAGRLVAELMAEQGVRTMIAGNFGRNIVTYLEEKGIRNVQFSGKSEEAIQAF